MGVAPGTSGDTLGCHTGEGHSSWHMVLGISYRAERSPRGCPGLGLHSVPAVPEA